MDIEFYFPRMLKFKAWNKESNLLMRLNSIDCAKGELFKKDHILLQFTGRLDLHGEEIYDMDVMLLNSEKYVVHWNDQANGWIITALKDKRSPGVLDDGISRTMVRLCSYFESAR